MELRSLRRRGAVARCAGRRGRGGNSQDLQFRELADLGRDRADDLVVAELCAAAGFDVGGTAKPTLLPTPAPTPAPTFLANDWWKQHFAEGKILSGTNLDAPKGYVAIEGAGPCMCRGGGWNLDSCGKLCCRGSPYTDPDPNGQYYIGKVKHGRICYKPEGAEYKDGDGGDKSGTASLAIIIPVVIAAVLLLAAILFLVRKRVVAARQHPRESMPTVGGDEAEAEA